MQTRAPSRNRSQPGSSQRVAWNLKWSPSPRRNEPSRRAAQLQPILTPLNYLDVVRQPLLFDLVNPHHVGGDESGLKMQRDQLLAPPSGGDLAICLMRQVNLFN
eukprot:CAMPEP_0184404158 /NCGR_PEP_ID=MMETSP0007-20130409/85792_1 /TAXON_ID=97485 /ORGANISM="Prymnesium parvum, Strain Texoma1" /LENGTH=103 /DNA_ID=CAMNT_0026760299 /DNA_START=666 /DNA_END=978 /DNA_ORIENTATION=+